MRAAFSALLSVCRHLKIEVRLRSQQAVTLCAHRVINCTGSEQDYRRVDSQLLRSLFRKGWLQSNPQGIGVRAAENGAVVDRQGKICRLYAIGPMRIGGPLGNHRGPRDSGTGGGAGEDAA